MCQCARQKKFSKMRREGFVFCLPFTEKLSTKCGSVARFFVAQICQVTASKSTENCRFVAFLMQDAKKIKVKPPRIRIRQVSARIR